VRFAPVGNQRNKDPPESGAQALTLSILAMTAAMRRALGVVVGASGLSAGASGGRVLRRVAASGTCHKADEGRRTPRSQTQRLLRGWCLLCRRGPPTAAIIVAMKPWNMAGTSATPSGQDYTVSGRAHCHWHCSHGGSAGRRVVPVCSVREQLQWHYGVSWDCDRREPCCSVLRQNPRIHDSESRREYNLMHDDS
jgi:hypothetical protein